MGTQSVANGPFEVAKFQLSQQIARVPPRVAPLTSSAEAGEANVSAGRPSRPLLGLPLARLVPQDVHSVMDYGGGLTVGAGAFTTWCPKARIASAVLATSVLGVSAVTDYRLSLAKIIPIEAHEAIDHVWGLSAIAAPFLFGYWKTAPKVALTHVVAGLSTIIASLVTDYRAARGVGSHSSDANASV